MEALTGGGYAGLPVALHLACTCYSLHVFIHCASMLSTAEMKNPPGDKNTTLDVPLTSWKRSTASSNRCAFSGVRNVSNFVRSMLFSTACKSQDSSEGNSGTSGARTGTCAGKQRMAVSWISAAEVNGGSTVSS